MTLPFSLCILAPLWEKSGVRSRESIVGSQELSIICVCLRDLREVFKFTCGDTTFFFVHLSVFVGKVRSQESIVGSQESIAWSIDDEEMFVGNKFHRRPACRQTGNRRSSVSQRIVTSKMQDRNLMYCFARSLRLCVK